MLNYRTITKQLLFCICSVEWSGAMIKYFVTKRDCQWIGLLSTLRTRATHRPASDQYSERSRRAAKSSPFRKRDDRRSVSETRPTYCLSRCLPRSRERESEAIVIGMVEQKQGGSSASRQRQHHLSSKDFPVTRTSQTASRHRVVETPSILFFQRFKKSKRLQISTFRSDFTVKSSSLFFDFLVRFVLTVSLVSVNMTACVAAGPWCLLLATGAMASAH